MRITSTVGRVLPLAAAAWAAMASLPSWAQTGLPDDLAAMKEEMAKLRAEIGELRAVKSEVEALRKQQDQNWMDQRRAEATAAVVRDVLADAETRKSLRSDQPTVGYDGGFFITDPEGRFKIKFVGVIKPRWMGSTQHDPPVPVVGPPAVPGDPDEYRGGFEMTCTRFGFTGFVVDPSWQYLILAKISGTGTLALLDSHVTKQLPRGFAVQYGQFQAPFLQEEIIFETRQQLVDRSLVAGALGTSYVQGINASWTGRWLKACVAVSDGIKTLNTPAMTADTDWAVTGRANIKLVGQWAQYAEFEAWRGDKPMVVLGLAAHAQDGEYGTPAAETRIHRFTADLMAKYRGLSLFAAAIAGSTQVNGSPDTDQMAFVIQGGVFATDKLELIGRFEYGDADVVAESDLAVLTLGFNYFFAKHQLKFTGDVGYAFNPVSDTWDNTALGWRKDAPGKDGQVVIRFQFQLLF